MDKDTGVPSEHSSIDPIWTASRTARQIFTLGEVDKDINRLLSLAASSIALLTLPQTDTTDTDLPKGEERSEQFVLEVSEFFERLDQVHINIRSTLAQIRQSRIAPSIIDAPSSDFIPRSSGVQTPSMESQSDRQGLQEQRVNRDAWIRIVDALTELRNSKHAELLN